MVFVASRFARHLSSAFGSESESSFGSIQRSCAKEMASRGDSRIYVGNLPPDVRTNDIEDLFYKFGRITNVDLKNHKDPTFAFLEFEDPRDASDAVKYRDGYNFDGYTLRVEFPRRSGPSSRGRMRGMGRGGTASRRSDYRVKVSGLPPTGSWQDLKDHMREAGDVCYTDVYKDGTGVVEFLKYDDMRYALRKLDDSKFVSHEGEESYLRVKEESGGSFRSRSRSRSPPPRRSSPPRRSRGSPRYSSMRSRSRSYSRSPY